MRLNRVPGSTYRLQFQGNFTFSQTTEILDYLQELGISDIYASPLFISGPESTHGYDVCGFDRMDPKLGGHDGFELLVLELHRRELGLLLDMVPNHMGSSPENAWWVDVLRNGPKSKYAGYFDIDWGARRDQKVLLPVLGDRYGAVLTRGELQLVLERGDLLLAYFDHRFPVSPATEEKILRSFSHKPAAIELQQLLDSINREVQKLHSIVQEQHYRLAYWRVGPEEINYRRFFDVTTLVSVRVEDEEVFHETHRFVLSLLKSGKVTGLRIDHPDGLRDPATYFSRLQGAFRTSESSPFLFVVAEKILSRGEMLPLDWNISGTTGYDFLNVLNGLFIAQHNANLFSAIYHRFTGLEDNYEEVEHRAKMEILTRLFPKELRSLTQRLRRIADASIEGVDFTTPELKRSICEYVAAFPVYRTYARPGKQRLTAEEQRYVNTAVDSASRRCPDLAPILGLLGKVLLLEAPASLTDSARAEWGEFVYRFQQLTGPATAKGVEDTAFYRYLRFVSLNEVGGNPGQFGNDIAFFHAHNRQTCECWPHSQSATATHDTKRGEDVRARLNVLSEMPDTWEAQIVHWRELNRHCKTAGASGEMPHPNDEYLLYQVMVGTWTPEEDIQAYTKRLQEYLQKATREAKQRTSWTDPSESYERATADFIRSVLLHDDFWRSFRPFATRVSFFATFNSLAQVILKTCSPGVPDFYQGTELWDLNLVDPDNRRPVDYARRQELLRQIKRRRSEPGYLASLIDAPESGELKMFTIWSALQFRNRQRQIFDSGNYTSLEAQGSKREHVVAFARSIADRNAVIVVPRLPLELTGGNTLPPLGHRVWSDTRLVLPPGTFRDQFTGRCASGSQPLGDLLSEFPAALLEQE